MRKNYCFTWTCMWCSWRKCTHVSEECSAWLYRVEEWDSHVYSVLQPETACSSEKSVNVYQKKLEVTYDLCLGSACFIFCSDTNYPDWSCIVICSVTAGRFKRSTLNYSMTYILCNSSLSISHSILYSLSYWHALSDKLD